jgi:hypothetical protein
VNAPNNLSSYHVFSVQVGVPSSPQPGLIASNGGIGLGDAGTHLIVDTRLGSETHIAGRFE